MIKLAFMAPNREIIRFEIENRVIIYFDKNWTHGLQIMPLNKSLVQSLCNSRSDRLKAQGLLIIEANNDDNLKEYDACKTDHDLAEMVRRDSKAKGLREVS